MLEKDADPQSLLRISIRTLGLRAGLSVENVEKLLREMRNGKCEVSVAASVGPLDTIVLTAILTRQPDA